MSFDIDLLKKNQRQYILSNFPDWEKRYPDTVAFMRKLFPVEDVGNSLDSFITDVFSFLNTQEIPRVRFGTMSGPVGAIEGIPCVSRPSKIRGSLHTPTAVTDYANNILHIINGNNSRLMEKGGIYTYNFYMWIPVYGINTVCGCGLMTHYAQRVEWER